MPRKIRTAERVGFALVALPLLAIVALLVGTSGAQEGRPDMITSSNVEFIRHLPEASDGVGARVVGNRLFVTTTKDLIVYDITDPPNPQRLGSLNANISFENEEVPTNGKVLGVSGQIGGCAPVGGTPALSDNCLVIYDVSKPEAPVVASVVPNAGDHTHTCVFDCRYFIGSSGTIVDATDPYAAKVVVDGQDRKIDWQATMGRLDQGCHHQNEVRPGIVIAACQPIHLVSMRAEDGGSVERPAVLGEYRHDPQPREDPPYYSSGPGTDPIRRFIHGVRWPNQGADKFILAGGETNFQARCHDRVGKFEVLDATRPSQQGSWTQTDEVWPQNGNYQDGSGRGQTQILGCSAHWFEEHPRFRNGGLVALAEYEQGTRFMQVTPEGTIRQLGYALPIGGSTSAPHWAPDGRTVYNIDYTRGLDVLRYNGSLVVPREDGTAERPPQETAPGEKPLPEEGASKLDDGSGDASGGGSSDAAPVACASDAGFERFSAQGDRISIARREQLPFTFDLFRQSKGRRVVDKRIDRYQGSASTLRLPRRAPRGFYLARVRMDLPGTDDVRRVALRRKKGRWSVRPDAYLRETCAFLKAFKLERTVFGGSRRIPLRIAYRLQSGVDSVTLEVRRGNKLLKEIDGPTTRGRAHRFRVRPAIARKRSDVSVTIVVKRAGALVKETLVSRRL